MRFKNSLLILSTALFLIACSSSRKMETEPTAAESNDLLQKGFLLSVPTADNWTVVKKSDYKVFLAKQGAKQNEQYTLQAVVVSLPTFTSDEEFLDFIKRRMIQASPTGAPQNTTLFSGHSEPCVQNASKEESLVKGRTVILEVVNFTCRHPDNKTAGVYLAYSKKYFEDENEENITANARELFSRLYFTEL